ncbi:MAG: radical SAM protein [Deferribacteraceae bacterium]|nr:radical SAM protein [Deferribacteraceae bacterium]
MQTIAAKTILTKFSKPSDWFGLDYNMNLYRGCCHGCIYCDSRSDCYGIENFDTIRVKEDCIAMLARELKSKRQKGVVGIGAMSDPYNPFELEHEYTRKALGWIDHFRFGISIVTKSAMIARDAELFAAINQHSPVITKLTITAEDELSKLIEPNVSPSSARFEALATLAKAGIFTGVMLMPMLPFITDTYENIEQIVTRAAESGARFIYPSYGVTLRGNQRQHFYKELDAHFPRLKAQYIQRYGEAYACGTPIYKELRRLFEAKCREHGLLYDMEKIIAAYKYERELW